MRKVERWRAGARRAKCTLPSAGRAKCWSGGSQVSPTTANLAGAAPHNLGPRHTLPLGYWGLPTTLLVRYFGDLEIPAGSDNIGLSRPPQRDLLVSILLVWYKHWKGQRWWEVEHSQREGSM